MIQAVPVVLGQPFIANRAIESFHIRILLRLAWLNIFKPNPTAQSPGNNRRTEVLRAVIAPNRQGLTAPVNDLLQRTYDAFRWQREVHLDTQRLAVEVVNHIQQPDASAVDQLVMHEIHRPDLVHAAGHRQRLRGLPDEPFTRLDTQIQLQPPINAVNTLVVPFKALDVAQV